MANDQIHSVNLWLQFLLLSIVAAFAGTALAQGGATRAELPSLKVGDRWKYEQSDRRTGVKESELDRRVTSVTASQIEGTENDGKFVWTPELNVVESPTAVVSGEPKALSFPLEIGKKWDYKYSLVAKPSGTRIRFQLEANVVAYEKVKVPAGEFDAFRIEYKGFRNNDTDRRNSHVKIASWFAPATRSVVKTEYEDGRNYWVRHLMEFQLQP